MQRFSPRRLHPVLLVLATGTMLVVAAAPAAAHVSISPQTAPRGDTTQLTFRVPNEEARAHTEQVSIAIPTAHPIAQVLAQPVEGWTVRTRSTRLTKPLVTDDGSFTSVVSEVTWSGGKIQPGQFQDFALSVDPLPTSVDRLVFKTLQTYSNGDVVRWIDLQQPGQDEPEHPAPVLTLMSPTDSSAASVSATPKGPTVSASTSSTATSTWPGVVAVVSLVIALLAAVLASLSLRRGRRST